LITCTAEFTDRIPRYDVVQPDNLKKMVEQELDNP